jgi:hypothetical protein
MKIRDLFIKPVDRHIEGVIKADDNRDLKTEVEEYVITKDVEKGLNEFTERYLSESSTNGVWISGFFGSGKSHLLKMLSLILDDRPLPSGEQAVDIFLPKVEDEILRGELKRAARIPSRSILFNIDQKSDAIGGDQGSPILEVFIKVLNELQGYYAKQGHIARFEYDLDSRGELEAFRTAYAEHSGRAWQHDLPVIETLENETFAEVYAKHFGKAYDEGLRLFDRLRDNYRVSIEDLGERVKAYLDTQGPDFRLNFFVDEVGQFIGEDTQRMLNLQTVAETLATKCNGRAWVIVTSQGDLRSVLGQLKKNEGDQFSKIEGRFKTRLTLTGADVREVIQKRLLAKHEPEPEVLTTIYDLEKDNLKTLYRFADGSVEYKGWRGSDEFCNYYPFHTYQFDLFQRAIEQLSRHDAFTGRHTSVGERSMLAVFQEVAKEIRNHDVGQLATFDLMFEGVAASLRGDIQTAVKQAARQLDDPVAVRVIKALFLLKWVREFKATPRNVAILLIDRPDIDIQQHEKAVREALNLLEAQSYLQRNGDCYEFLTDTEKDIEVEIKNTDIDETQMFKLLSDILFTDILRDPKIRYEGNGQDYSYARRLDDHLVGRETDLSINIITTDHPNHGELMTLAAQNTGKAELLAVLPADLRLANDARLFLKTQKYVQQNTGGSLDETRRAILTERGRQNSLRRSALQTLCSELMSKAPLYLNGSALMDIGEGDPRNRFAKASQSLIAFAYPSLRMLRGSYDERVLTQTLMEPDDLFAAGGQTLSEAEQEVLTYVMRNQNNGERTSVEEIIRNFGKRPYGWYPMAVLTQVARLFRMGKVELRTTDLLDARSALDAFKNSRQHGGIRVRLQEQFDAGKVNALKRFFQDFFDRVNDATDPRSVAQLTSEALAGEARDLGLLLDQANIYPFLKQLRPHAERIKQIAEKDYAYLLNHLTDFSDELLDAKDNMFGPIKAFMHGPQRRAYDEVLTFYRTEEANFGEIDASELEPLQLLDVSQAPFRGTVLPNAKAAVARIRSLIDAQLDAERATANATLDQREAQLRSVEDFIKLDPQGQTSVLAKTNEAREAIASARFVSSIRDRLSRYTSQEYPTQLALAARLAAPPAVVDPAGNEPAQPDIPEPRYVSVGALKVSCPLPFIANETELDEWLNALRKAVAEELSKGNRISL